MRRLLVGSLAFIMSGCAPTAPPAVPVHFEELTIVDTSETSFDGIQSIRELSYAVLVSDGVGKRLVSYDPATGQQRIIGRIGDGPGEYQRPAQLWALPRDSTLMAGTVNMDWDVLVGTQIVGALPTDDPVVVGALRGLTSFDTVGSALILRLGARGDSQSVERIDRATGQSRVLARVDPPTASMSLPPAYPAQYVDAIIAPDGWVAIRQAHPYRVDWIAPDGARIDGDSIPQEVVRVDGAEREYILSTYEPESAELSRRANVWPPHVPPVAVGSLLISPLGELVVRRIPTRQHPGRPYDVVGRDGKLVRRIIMPREQRIVGFGAASVYMEMTTEDGTVRLGRAPWPGMPSAR